MFLPPQMNMSASAQDGDVGSAFIDSGYAGIMPPSEMDAVAGGLYGPLDGNKYDGGVNVYGMAPGQQFFQPFDAPTGKVRFMNLFCGSYWSVYLIHYFCS